MEHSDKSIAVPQKFVPKQEKKKKKTPGNPSRQISD